MEKIFFLSLFVLGIFFLIIFIKKQKNQKPEREHHSFNIKEQIEKKEVSYSKKRLPTIPLFICHDLKMAGYDFSDNCREFIGHFVEYDTPKDLSLMEYLFKENLFVEGNEKYPRTKIESSVVHFSELAYKQPILNEAPWNLYKPRTIFYQIGPEGYGATGQTFVIDLLNTYAIPTFDQIIELLPSYIEIQLPSSFDGKNFEKVSVVLQITKDQIGYFSYGSDKGFKCALGFTYNSEKIFFDKKTIVLETKERNDYYYGFDKGLTSASAFLLYSLVIDEIIVSPNVRRLKEFRRSPVLL